MHELSSGQVQLAHGTNQLERLLHLPGGQVCKRRIVVVCPLPRWQVQFANRPPELILLLHLSGWQVCWFWF